MKCLVPHHERHRYGKDGWLPSKLLGCSSDRILLFLTPYVVAFGRGRILVELG